MKPITTAYLFLTLISLLSFSTVSAQDYSLAVGLRAGSATGVSVKSFVTDQTAIEGLLVYRRGGSRVIALASHHIPLGRRTGASLFVGAGGHFGYNYLFEAETSRRMVYGVDAQVGVEFEFPHSPMSLALELKPMVEMRKGIALSGNNAAVTLRYLLY